MWDFQLAKEGAKVIKTRRGFLSRIEKKAKDAHLYLTEGKEELVLDYESVAGEKEEEIYENLLAAFKKDRERDIYHGFTHSGAQTDDFAALIGEVDVRKYGSQGQQRTTALSLKLAQLELFYEETGEYPVLLLDDVFSELDETRQQRLVEKINGHQTIVTCTHIEDRLAPYFQTAKFFKVVNGEITEE